MTFKAEVLRGIKWTAGAKFSGQLVTWGITIAVMRLLSPADYGLLAMASVFLALLGMFAEIGLGPALVQTAEISTEKLRQAFGIVLTINTLLCLLLATLAPAVAAFYAEPRLTDILRVLSLQFLFIAFSVLPEVLLQRRLEFKQRSLIELSSAIAGAVATLGAAYAHLGVWSLVIGNLAIVVWRAIAMNCVSPFPHMPSFSWTGMRSLFMFGGNVTGSRLLWFLFTQADTVIIGRVLGRDTLGLYSVAMHLATLPVQRVSSILNQVAFPTFSRFQDDLRLVVVQLLKALAMVSFIAFPVLWGMASVSRELVLVLLGPGWDKAIVPLQILTLVMPFRAIVGFLPSITDAIGHPEIGLKNVAVACLTMPVAFYVGTNWGIEGVAFAWLIVYPFVLFSSMRRMLAVLGITLTVVAKKIAPSVGSAALMFAAVTLVRYLVVANNDVKLVLAAEIFTGAVVYTGAALLLNRTVLNEIRSVFLNKSSASTDSSERPLPAQGSK